MKRLIAAISATVCLANPAQASGWWWQVNDDVQLRIVPAEETKKPVVTDGHFISGSLQFVYKGKRNFPIRWEHRGNTCASPSPNTPSNQSTLTVCSDESYYEVVPNWDKENYYTMFNKWDCRRPIKVWDKWFNLTAVCKAYKM